MDEALALIAELSARNENLLAENEVLRVRLWEAEAPLPPAEAERVSVPPIVPKPFVEASAPPEPDPAPRPAPLVKAEPEPPFTGPQDYVIRPHVEGYVKWGNERSLAGTEAFVPISWNGQLLSFMDMRFVTDDNSGREGNFGLGGRWVPEGRDFLIGAYGFYDRRRTETGSIFAQATLGTEFLTEDWDLRANGYIALSDDKVLRDITEERTTLNLTGTNIVAQTTATRTRQVETPLSGFDIEAGHRLTFLKDTWFADTSGYGAFFRFDADGVKAMNGYRARLASRPLEWLELGLEHQSDNIRGTSNFAEVRLRLPFGSYPSQKHKPEGIYARLDERVIRDIDVVTQSQPGSTSQSSTAVPVVNTATGNAQNIYTVDNTAAAGGDGSTKRPFNTLAAAETAAGAHDIIYVRRGDGTTAGQNAGISLDEQGQRLIGSGVALTFDTGTLSVAGLPFTPADGQVILAAADAGPVITNTGGDGITISADDITVRGLTVAGAADDGFEISGDNATISAVTISGSTGYGVRETGAATGLNLSGNTFAGAGNYLINDVAGTTLDASDNSFSDLGVNPADAAAGGFDTTELAALFTLEDRTEHIIDNPALGTVSYAPDTLFVTVNTPGVQAGIDTAAAGDTIYVGPGTYDETVTVNKANISLYGANAGVSPIDGLRAAETVLDPTNDALDIVTVSADGVTVDGFSLNSGSDAFTIAAAGTNATLSNLIVTSPGQDGISVQADTLTVTDTTVDSAGRYGLYAEANGAAAEIANLSVRDSTFSASTSYGAYLYAVTAGQITAPAFDNVTVSGGDDLGFYFLANGAGSAITGPSLTNSALQDNVGYGLYMRAANGGQVTAPDLSGSAASDNGTYGIYYEANGAGAVLSNGNLTGVTVSDNISLGLYMRAVSGGQITGTDLTNLSATENGSNGVHLESNAAGSSIAGTVFTGAQARDNFGSGFHFSAVNSGQINTLDLTDIASADNNAGNGIYLYAQSAQIDAADLSGLTVSDNGTYGIRYEANGAGAVLSNGNLTGVTVSDNVSLGLYMRAINGGQITGTDLTNLSATENGNNGVHLESNAAGSTITGTIFTGAQARDNFGSGFYFYAVTNSNMSVELEGATATDNAGHGVYIDDESGTGTVTVDLGGGALGSTGGNRIFGNVAQDIRVDLDGGQLKAENNWWGNAAGLQGGETTFEDASTIDANPFLAADPH